MPEQQEEHLFVRLARDLRQRGNANMVLGGGDPPMQLNLLLSPGKKAHEKLLHAAAVTGRYHTATYTLMSAPIVLPTHSHYDIAAMIQQVVEELYYTIEQHMKEAEILRGLIEPAVRR